MHNSEILLMPGNSMDASKYMKNKNYLQNEVMKLFGRFLDVDGNENDVYEVWVRGGKNSNSALFSRILAEMASNDEKPFNLGDLDKEALQVLSVQIVDEMKKYQNSLLQ